MEKDLERLSDHIKNKQYSKILQTLSHVKQHNTELDNEHLQKFIAKQEEILKMIITNDVQLFLHNKKNIPAEIYEIMLFFDEEFQNKIMDEARNCLSDFYGETFRKKCSAVKGINDISEVLRWYDEEKSVFEQQLSGLPEKWNVMNVVVLKFCDQIGNRIAEVVDKHVELYDMMLALDNCIHFEQNNTRFIKCGKIAISKPPAKNNKQILFCDDGIRVENSINLADTNCSFIVHFDTENNIKHDCLICENKKKLSRSFSKHLKSYVKELCKQLGDLEINQDIHEMQVIKSFIEFFNCIAKIYHRISYFDEITPMEDFADECNAYLTRHLQKISIKYEFKQAVVLSNTLVFLNQTFVDFLQQVTRLSIEKFQGWESFKNIHKLEKQQLNILNAIIKKKISKTNINYTEQYSSKINDFINTNILVVNFKQLFPDISDFIFGVVFSLVFYEISKYKLNAERAENMISELYETRVHLSKITENIPMITTIETYLKIFLIHPENSDDFVRNFISVGDEKFMFSQVLRKLIDKTYNAKLYMLYQTNSKFKQRRLLNNNVVATVNNETG